MEKMRLTETKFIPNETSVQIENYPTEITSFNQIYHPPLRCNIVVKIFSESQENSKYSTVEKFQVIESNHDLKNKSESICIMIYNDQLMFIYDENVNSIDYALKELDKDISNIFVYTDIKKFNKPITIIQGLKDKVMIKIILRELKKNIGTGGT